MQRHHYIKVCKKFLDQNDKLKVILLEYRKKDCLEDVTETEVSVGVFRLIMGNSWRCS